MTRIDTYWLWLATEEWGLCAVTRERGPPLGLLDPERWRCLGADRGLDSLGVHGSMPDGAGRVWMSANRGIGVAPESSLWAFAEGDRDTVEVTWLGTEAGLLDPEANGTIGGTVVATPDGSLYFPTQHGVAKVVPDRYADPPMPRVALDGAQVDGEAVGLDGPMLRLSASSRLVGLRWSTVSLASAEGVKVRHRFAADGRWSQPTTDTMLQLRGLEPGDHHFEVQAGIGEGWGPSTHLTLSRPPKLTERRDIRLGALAAASLTLFAVFGLQRRRSQRRARALQARIDEATDALRVANDLLAIDNVALAEQAVALDTRNAKLDHQNSDLASQGARLKDLVHETESHASQLEELDRLKRRLMANISHELRTPLTLIRGPIEVLAATEADPVRRRDLLLATRNAARLDALVHDLLLLSRAESGNLPLRAQRTTLQALLSRLLDRFPQDRLVLAPLPLDPPERLWCDPAVVDTALGNLIANALEHGGTHTPVTVTVRHDSRAGAPGVTIAVRDQGPGIAEGASGTLFQRFERGDAQGGGLGLGLALARELIELHGGQLDRIAPEQGGACFQAWLPLGAEHLAIDDIDVDTDALHEPQPAAPQPATSATAVLLVEDNAELRGFLAAHLRTRHHVMAMRDAESALEWLKTNTAKAVVSDIMLPGMSGIDLAHRLRLTPANAPLPILLISARGEVQDRIEGLAVADDYLPKPFSIRELFARLDALLRRVRAHAAPPRAGSVEAPKTPVRPAWMDDLTNALDTHIEAHLSDPSLDARALARAVGMSQRTRSARLREHSCPSPAAWIRERRLARAEEMLRVGTHQTVGEVAASVGMSRAYFTRAFKALTGRAPGDLMGGG